MRQTFYTLIFSLLYLFGYNQSSTVGENEESTLGKFLWSYSQSKKVINEKSILDFNAIDNWQLLGNYLAVSNNGLYFAYTIERGSPNLRDEYRHLDSLIIQSTMGSWRHVYAYAIPGFFADNNKQYVFKSKDSLCFQELGKDKCKYIDNIKSYKPSKAKNDWIAYELKDSDESLVLRNFRSEKEQRFNKVSNYAFDESGQWLVYQLLTGELVLHSLSSSRVFLFRNVKEYTIHESGKYLLFTRVEKVGDQNIENINYVNLGNGLATKIWETNESGTILGAHNLNRIGNRVVFVTENKGNSQNSKEDYSIWYFQEGTNKGVVKVSNKTEGILGSFQVSKDATFTDNGRYIQFGLVKKLLTENHETTGAQLDVWNYKDLQLQSNQAYLSTHSQTSTAIVRIEDGQVIPIENEEQHLYLLHGDFALVKKTGKDIYGDRFWEKAYNHDRDSNWIISLIDNNRTLFPGFQSEGTWFSPNGNYLVYFDTRNHHYYSYHLPTKRLFDITPNVSESQLNYLDPFLTTKNTNLPVGIGAWLPDDMGLLVYDNNDIWKLDITGKGKAINITNGFGRLNNIIFSLFSAYRKGSNDGIPILNGNPNLILKAFNKGSRYSGFYQVSLKGRSNPKLLSMEPFFTEYIPFCQDPNLTNRGKAPLKSLGANNWIVQRESDVDAPNYFETSDFKSFRRLTNFQPQKSYNWLSEELHSFKHLDGKIGQGVLYKSENFDPTKKYPVLVVFYGNFSNNLYQFPIPAYNTTAIGPGETPAWFLNNGYLVFTPDIYVAPTKYGLEAFNVIEGAVQYLKALPYVDADKIACASHSWSAKLGTYIYTHSNSITASVISEGFLYGNMINVALSTNEQGVSKLDQVEDGFQFGNFWQYKDLWMEQTTVLNVDKAKSPLLLYCNKESSQEYQNQTLQLFNSLRRLEKKVWWLKYDKGGHTLSDLDEQKDYTIRYTQFLDHYLKGAPAPKWMTRGIPYSLRGLETGYELDPSGTCDLPYKKECPICKAWNVQYKRTPKMFSKPIAEWKLDDDLKKQMEKEETEKYNENMKGEAERIRENNAKLNGTWKGEKY